ncbi:transposase, partial [Thermus scotoductus]|uniref:transposase n=1 Tax=Thermus scotoductus TaxID=37636 RepID=UPI001F01C725
MPNQGKGSWHFPWAKAGTLGPQSRWGRDSKGQWVYGYKLHLLLDLDTGEILAHKIAPTGLTSVTP